MTLKELRHRLDQFSPAKIRFVAALVESLANPPQADIRERCTWLTQSPDWIEYFGLALALHHGTSEEPLGLVPFETVFRNACTSVQWDVSPHGSATQRFVDLEVATGPDAVRRLSLKSTAASKIAKTSAHISKLTEAAWIQDVRTARDRQTRMRELFRQYRNTVDAIIQLRAFRRDRIPVCYQLLEIPTTIFASIDDAPLDTFQREAPAVPCLIDGQCVAVVAVDRSDAKITVRKIRLSACTVHVEWHRR